MSVVTCKSLSLQDIEYKQFAMVNTQKKLLAYDRKMEKKSKFNDIASAKALMFIY